MMVRLLPASIAGLLVLACNGGGQPPSFAYTPEPYTVLASSSATAVPIAESEAGDKYVADEVLVSVKPGKVQDVSRAAARAGFTVQRTVVVTPEFELLLIKVPVGSVPDAIRWFGSIDGVAGADPNVLRELLGTPR